MEEKKTTNTESTHNEVDVTTESAVAAELNDESVSAAGAAEDAAPAVATKVDTSTPASPVAGSATPAVASRSGIRQYVIAVAVVAVFGVGLVFALEQQGRIDTNLFGWIQSSEQTGPVAIVNGVEISGAEFTQNRNQIIVSAQQQGVDINDPVIAQDIDTQALEVLVNTQLLRQAATASGITVSEEDIDARYQEIVESVGGEETLTNRMIELGITPATLRDDIADELLIQFLIETELDTSNIAVSDTEVDQFYEQAGGTEAGLPPLADIRAEIEQQIRAAQEQSLVAEYINTLREAAEIEILI